MFRLSYHLIFVLWGSSYTYNSTEEELLWFLCCKVFSNYFEIVISARCFPINNEMIIKVDVIKGTEYLTKNYLNSSRNLSFDKLYNFNSFSRSSHRLFCGQGFTLAAFLCILYILSKRRKHGSLGTHEGLQLRRNNLLRLVFNAPFNEGNSFVFSLYSF